MQVGDVYILRINGGTSFTTGITPNFSITFGGTSNTVVVPHTGASSNTSPYSTFNIEVVFTVRTIGTSGTYKFYFTYNVATNNTTNTTLPCYIWGCPYTGNVNTTVSSVFDITYNPTAGSVIVVNAMSLIKQ